MSVEWDKIKALNLCFKCCLASLYCQWTAYAWDRVESWDIGKLSLYCTYMYNKKRTKFAITKKNSHLIHMWHLPNIELLLMVSIKKIKIHKEKTKIFVHTALGPRISLLWHPHFSYLLSASKPKVRVFETSRLLEPTAKTKIHHRTLINLMELFDTDAR